MSRILLLIAVLTSVPGAEPTIGHGAADSVRRAEFGAGRGGAIAGTVFQARGLFLFASGGDFPVKVFQARTRIVFQFLFFPLADLGHFGYLILRPDWL